MSKLLVLIQILILVSCASNQYTQNIDSDLHVVDIDSSKTYKTSTGIANDIDGVGTVGPDVPGAATQTRKQLNKEVWGLVLSPGLNRVICHAVAVRALNEKGIRFNVVSGSGMGAIIAAHLAMGATPEIIEWKFHKFFQNAKGLKPFSKDWLEQVKKDLLVDFKGKNIQSTKLTLVIPLYNNVERKVEYVRRGSLYDKLIANITFSNERKDNYSSIIERESVVADRIRELGVEKIVSINALSGKIKFERKEDYLFGLYGRLSSTVNKSSFDFSLNLPLDDFSLDEIKNLPEYLRVSYLFLRDNSQTIREEFVKGTKID